MYYTKRIASLSAERQTSEWATSLPWPAASAILDKLLEPDHLRFAAVCKEWRSLSKDYGRATQRWRPSSNNIIPMLLLPSEYHGGNKDSLRNRKAIYSLSEGRTYHDAQLRVPFSKRCCGSSHGWLATVAHHSRDEDLFYLKLWNPFKKARSIDIPPLKVKINEWMTDYCEYCIPKVILSADPDLDPDNYVVVAIYDWYFRLAFLKKGQTNWTRIHKPYGGYSYSDVIYYRSQIFALGRYGHIVSIDVMNSSSSSSGTITSSNPNNPSEQKKTRAKLLLPKKPAPYVDLQSYLVESTKGDLLYIRRFYRPMSGKRVTESFLVYKLIFNDQEGSIVDQVAVNNIGDEALFVGSNHSVAVHASNFSAGCHPNCIYYTDDNMYILVGQTSDWPRDDMGVFNLKDGIITQHYSDLKSSHLERYLPPAIWVMPSFNGLY